MKRSDQNRETFHPLGPTMMQGDDSPVSSLVVSEGSRASILSRYTWKLTNQNPGLLSLVRSVAMSVFRDSTIGYDMKLLNMARSANSRAMSVVASSPPERH